MPTVLHMYPPTHNDDVMAVWLVIAMCLIAAIEGVTIAILVAAKRRSRRAALAVPDEAPDREEVAA